MKKFGITVVLLSAAASFSCASGDDNGGEGGAGMEGATTGGMGEGGGGHAEQTDDDRRAAVNGCTASRAKNELHHAEVTIVFPAHGELRYSPACVKVSRGTRVTFKGPFSEHPLQAGVVRSNGTVAVDHDGPIHQTKSGKSETFKFRNDGTYAYFCERHFSLGMYGAIIVD